MSEKNFESAIQKEKGKKMREETGENLHKEEIKHRAETGEDPYKKTFARFEKDKQGT